MDIEILPAERRRLTSIALRFKELSDRLDELRTSVQEAQKALESARAEEVFLQDQVMMRTGASREQVVNAMIESLH